MAVLHEERVLDFNADSCEWCPVEGFSHSLAVGTYQLQEDTGTRVGRVYLYDVSGEPGSSCHLQQLATLDTAGIFDMRWQPPARTCSRPLLALALADGTVSLTSPIADAIQPLCQAGEGQEGGMVLSLDFQRASSGAGNTLVASTSQGRLWVLQVGDAELRISSAWHAHDLEAWVVACDCWQEGLIYSGADDCTFKGWDLRQAPDLPIFSNRKAHGAGVCCMQSSPHREHMVVTGSYDEVARLWDTRAMHQPLQKSQVTTGGGVWRLKWHPQDPDLLLATCMHNGFAVLRASRSTGELRVEEEYSEQKTLGYGGDWCHKAFTDRSCLVATCSFYDRLLHLWTPATKYTHHS